MALLLPSAAIMNWAIPFAGALITPVIGFIAGKLKDGGAKKGMYFVRNWMATATSFIAFLFSILLVVDIYGGNSGVELFQTDWFFGLENLIGTATDYKVGFGILVDPLNVMIACFATGVGTMIMIFGVGYMKGDKHLDRYWFLMQTFIGGMVFLVMANNFFQTFVGWEIVGFCSFALIGYFFNKKEKQDPREITVKEETEGDYNSHAGLKAFITTRIGDVAMLSGILILFFNAGTFNYMELLSDLTWMTTLQSKNLLVITAILIFGGPIGKSAQFPLQFWLPEAMAGPTTVSALIHAAAMVKAGVFMVGRTFPMWYMGLHELQIDSLQIYFIVVAAVGAFTAFMAATMGMANLELKKILAFSTISQLGYMFLGLGVGGLVEPTAGFTGYFAGSFHMLSHAVFKGLLFLSAGAVIHAVHTKYVDEMGGIRKELPKVFWPMLIGGLSLAGIPILGGFFSKESVFGACWELWHVGHNALGLVFLIVAAIVAAMTLFYTLRMLGYAFLGDKSDNVKHAEKEQGGHLHKPSKSMWIPLWILAGGTIVMGFLSPLVENFLTRNTWFTAATLFTAEQTAIDYGGFLSHTFGSWTFLATVIALGVGFLFGYMFYIGRKWDAKKVQENKFMSGITTFFAKRWYMNTAIYWCVRKFKRFAELSYEYFDLKVIDRANYVIADGTMKSGEVFRKTHTGILSVNFIYMLLGAIVLLAVLLFTLGG
ncbi:MAG: NADH-quinone oxidoreductase subunit L [Candidatus Heimdallarchaeota archaeon]|nr:NADH-quinone oxidoreductase subunit L [Candidatus Heimdallarchaeota archaeon]MBY8993976.1 NADH-quinone oxidoreductase subunit L [Candidatus Heimdallarchaeota archaeon]